MPTCQYLYADPSIRLSGVGLKNIERLGVSMAINLDTQAMMNISLWDLTIVNVEPNQSHQSTVHWLRKRPTAEFRR